MYAAAGSSLQHSHSSTCLQQYSHLRDTKTSGHTAHLGHGAHGGGVEAGTESSHRAPAYKHKRGAKWAFSQQQGLFNPENVSNNVLRDCQCSCLAEKEDTTSALQVPFQWHTPVLLAGPITKPGTNSCRVPLHGESLYVNPSGTALHLAKRKGTPCVPTTVLSPSSCNP